MRNWIFAAAAIMAVESSREARAADPAASAAQCEAAWSYAQQLMADLGNRPLVFASERFFFAQLPGAGASWDLNRHDQPISAPAPPPQLIEAASSENALALCPSFRARLTAMHIGYGEAAVRWAAHRQSRGSFRATIVTISLPAISADGRHAVLGESTVSAPLGGGASLVHLVRNGGGPWQVAGQIGLWVS